MKLNHWAALAAGLLGCFSASAYTPAAGTISPSNPKLEASGGPYAASNPTPAPVVGGEPDCTPATCDEYLMTVDISPEYRAANPTQVVRVRVGDFGADDLDMYIYDAATDARIGSSASGSPEEVSDLTVKDIPASVRIVVVPYTVTGSTSKLTMEITRGAGSGSGGGGEDPCAMSGTANSGSAMMDLDVRRDFTRLASGADYGAFVRFNQGTTKHQDALLKKHGLQLKGDFRKYVNSVYVQGPVSAFNRLSRERAVGWIEANRELQYLDASSNWATRVRVAQEQVSGGPYLDNNGDRITGKGQLLGVIDSGMFGAHPDFDGRVLHNFKLTQFVSTDAPQYIDVGEQDSENAAGGHGSHVTGTVMGNGAFSDGGYPLRDVAPFQAGTFTGTAPEASMVHWAHGAVILVLSTVTAYEHMLDNMETFETQFGSPLRAVNNSYGNAGGSQFNPAATDSCLIKDIVERGTVMVFAAGNDGGDGSADMTSSACKHTTPGVICVASYNDDGTGKLGGALSGFSSRGKKGDPVNYPDVSAPGDAITSTCSQATGTQAICTGGDDQAAETEWQPLYGTISGTSMAAPHITGIIGLMTQVKPDLTPEQIEKLLQKHARKIGPDYEPDPQHSGSSIHFAYGAGLVDVPAMLTELGAKKAGLPPKGGEWVIFDGDEDATVAELASDAVKLTMQEETLDGLTGVRFRVTVADVTDFVTSTALNYRVEMNVAGEPYATTVQLTPAGAVIAEAGAGNTAVAQAAAVEGNVLSFFVPYTQMGFPALIEPIHNIRVVVSDRSGAVDYAPSPADVPASVAAVQPMFGRAFTVQLPPGVAPPSDEKSCVAPGLTQLTSPAGLTGNGLPSGQDDLRHLWIAEPETMAGKLVITLKMANLSQVPPNYRWYAYFKVPGDTAEYWAAMDSTQVTPRFLYGVRSGVATPAATFGSFSTLGTLDAMSSFNANGTIQLVIDKASFPTPITEGMGLSALAASIRQTTNPQNGVGLTTDSAAAIGEYKVVGNMCKAAVAAPAPVTPAPLMVMQPAQATAAAVGSNGGRFGGALGLALLPLLGGACCLRRRQRA